MNLTDDPDIAAWQNIAWRKAYQSKGSAEYVAARHAEWRVQEKMDAEAGESVVLLQERYPGCL